MSHPYLPAVIDLVRQAGVVTLPFWRCDTAVTAKLDDSPVTAADLAAQEATPDAGHTAARPHRAADPRRGRWAVERIEPVECLSVPRARGLEVEILSGDSEAAVAEIAGKLGVTRWQAGVRPATATVGASVCVGSPPTSLYLPRTHPPHAAPRLVFFLLL